VQHDPDTAIEFLRRLKPHGPWVLTSIAVDQKGIDTATFGPDDEIGVDRFLRQFHNRNVYYMLNEPTGALDEKADKTEVASCPWLHVDIDPREVDSHVTDLAARADHIARDRVRILKLIENPPAPIPPPSVIIDSGGGFQAIWKLREPVLITGTTKDQKWASCEIVERYNITLWRVLGGDNCHNADRILRLPGTVNWPPEKKKERGRTVAMSGVVAFTDAVYDLSMFTPAAPVQVAGAGLSTTRSGSRVRNTAVPRKADGTIRRYSPDELEATMPWGPRIPKRTLVKIVQGRDPDDPKEVGGEARGSRRSEWLFNVCCDLARAKVPDEVMYAVITDPDYRISTTVIGRPDAERYAWRQIDRAKEFAIHPKLLELNEKYAVIETIGGKCRIIQEQDDATLRRKHLVIQSVPDFKNWFANRQIQIGTDEETNTPIMTPLGKWWFEHPDRKQFDRIVFAPQRDVDGAYNLWQGFDVEPVAGTTHEPFLTYCKEVLCNDDENAYRYLVGWMARTVQYPDRQGEVAIVMRGDRGTGKGTFANIFGALFGRHFLAVSSGHHLVGNFNSALRDAVVVFADEAFFAGDRQHASTLKSMITEPTIMIENKGVDAELAPNYIHLIMASNEQWVIPVGNYERRFLVLDVSSKKRQDRAYFGAVRAAMFDNDRAGLSSLLYYLEHLDLTDFDVRDVPHTDALREQRMLSLDSMEEWWFKKLEDGILMPDHLSWTSPIFKSALVEDYFRYTQRVGARRSTETALGRFLKKVAPGTNSYQTRVEIFDAQGRRHNRVQVWEFPSLEKCRDAFEYAGFGTYPWPAIQLRDDIDFEARRDLLDPSSGDSTASDAF